MYSSKKGIDSEILKPVTCTLKLLLNHSNCDILFQPAAVMCPNWKPMSLHISTLSHWCIAPYDVSQVLVLRLPIYLCCQIPPFLHSHPSGSDICGKTSLLNSAVCGLDQCSKSQHERPLESSDRSHSTLLQNPEWSEIPAVFRTAELRNHKLLLPLSWL